MKREFFLVSKRELFLVSVLIVGFVSMAMAAPQKPKQNMRRVAEIAAMLPDEPGFPEARLGNRKMWDSLAKLPDANKAIKEGLRILSEPIPVLDDNIYTNTVREIWGPLSDKRMHNLVKLTLAECLENKGRFLPLACGYLDAIASQTTWMNPYHDRVCFGNFYGKYRSIDLNGSDAALCVAIALDTLKEKVPEETKMRAMAAMRKFMVEPYLKDAAGKGFKHSWFFGDNNWNPACHNQCVGAALRVVEDKIERAKFIGGPRVSRRRLGARSLPMFFSSARPSPTSATSFRSPAERNRGRSNFPIFAFSSSRENWWL
jgi:hypothetical protein